MSECDEVAASMAAKAPAFASYSEALTYVRQAMPDESETIISNVAWSLHINRSIDNLF
jgi:hypothetical protein